MMFAFLNLLFPFLRISIQFGNIFSSNVEFPFNFGLFVAFLLFEKLKSHFVPFKTTSPTFLFTEFAVNWFFITTKLLVCRIKKPLPRLRVSRPTINSSERNQQLLAAKAAIFNRTVTLTGSRCLGKSISATLTHQACFSNSMTKSDSITHQFKNTHQKAQPSTNQFTATTENPCFDVVNFNLKTY